MQKDPEIQKSYYFVDTGRVACPWLIRRFVDPQAEFLFVPREAVEEAVEREGAMDRWPVDLRTAKRIVLDTSADAPKRLPAPTSKPPAGN